MIPVRYSVLKAHENEYWELFEKMAKKGLKSKIGDEWESIKTDFPDLSKFFPYSFKEIVLGDFERLVDIYETYRFQYLPWLDRYKIVHPKKAKKLENSLYFSFHYKRKDAAIKHYFKRYATDLGIMSCNYCDTVPISMYNKDVSRFALDHVLDWSDCWLVCYSLYNFVPSCATCNTNIKGTKLIGANYDNTVDPPKFLSLNKPRMLKLSPCVQNYDFDGNVLMDVQPANSSDILYCKNPDRYKINFNFGIDADYDEYIRFFQLSERYNVEETKDAALWLMDQMKMNPLRKRKREAKRHKLSLVEYEDQLFACPLFKDRYQKMKRDLLKHKDEN